MIVEVFFVNSEHEILLGNIAQDYYLSNLSISDISKKYSISRYLILKYLDEARSTGLVSINIHTIYQRNDELEQRLINMFPIKNLYILKNPTNPAERDDLASSFAAYQIQAAIKNAHVVGLSWGDMIFSTLNKFRPTQQDDLVFTQFLGENMKYHSLTGSTRMVQRAAVNYNAPYFTIPGPLYILNKDVRKQLAKEPSMEKAFEHAKKMDMIISSVGTLDSIEANQPWYDNIDKIFPGVDLDEIAGMVFARPYDINGQFLIDEKDSTAFSTPLENILNVPRRFGIVTRKSKTNAVLGALRGGFFTDLITTESIALKILKELDKE